MLLIERMTFFRLDWYCITASLILLMIFMLYYTALIPSGSISTALMMQPKSSNPMI